MYRPGISYDFSPISAGAAQGAAATAAGIDSMGRSIAQGIASAGQSLSDAAVKNKATKDELEFLNSMASGLREKKAISDDEYQKFLSGSLGAKRGIVSMGGTNLNQIYKEQSEQADFNRKVGLAKASAKPEFDPTTAREVPLPGGAGSMIVDANGVQAKPGDVFKPEKGTNPFDFSSMQTKDIVGGGKVYVDGRGNILDPSKIVKDTKINPKFDFDSATTKDFAGIGRVLVDKNGEMLDPSKAFKLPDAKEAKKTEAEIAFDTNVIAALNGLKSLRQTVNDRGGYEGGVRGINDLEAHAKLKALPYQLAIQYAKIVDPGSVAREGEVAAAQKYLIPMGMTVPNKVTLAAIENMEKTIKEYQSARSAVTGMAPPPNSTPSDAAGVSTDQIKAALQKRLNKSGVAAK